jgi:hypothetical protein
MVWVLLKEPEKGKTAILRECGSNAAFRGPNNATAASPDGDFCPFG